MPYGIVPTVVEQPPRASFEIAGGLQSHLMQSSRRDLDYAVELAKSDSSLVMRCVRRFVRFLLPEREGTTMRAAYNEMLFTVLVSVSLGASALWGAFWLILRLGAPALACFSYTVVVGAGFSASVYMNRIEIVYFPLTLCLACVPWLVSVLAGGWYASGMTSMWSLLGPFVALYSYKNHLLIGLIFALVLLLHLTSLVFELTGVQAIICEQVGLSCLSFYDRASEYHVTMTTVYDPSKACLPPDVVSSVWAFVNPMGVLFMGGILIAIICSGLTVAESLLQLLLPPSVLPRVHQVMSLMLSKDSDAASGNSEHPEDDAPHKEMMPIRPHNLSCRELPIGGIPSGRNESQSPSPRLIEMLSGPVTHGGPKVKSIPIVLAQAIPLCGVMFADLCSFTAISSTLTPFLVLKLVSLIFAHIDDVAHRLNVRRVKTIGDCWMGACNIGRHISETDMDRNLSDAVRMRNSRSSSRPSTASLLPAPLRQESNALTLSCLTPTPEDSVPSSLFSLPDPHAEIQERWVQCQKNAKTYINAATDEDLTNILNIVMLGLCVICAVNRELSIKLETELHCRVGISCGPVIAGVMSHVTYDVFGDTCNIASRMESSSYKDSLQVSGEVASVCNSCFPAAALVRALADPIDANFGAPPVLSVPLEQTSVLQFLGSINGVIFVPRGNLPIKGKGNMLTFWVISSLSELS